MLFRAEQWVSESSRGQRPHDWKLIVTTANAINTCDWSRWPGVCDVSRARPPSWVPARPPSSCSSDECDGVCTRRPGSAPDAQASVCSGVLEEGKVRYQRETQHPGTGNTKEMKLARLAPVRGETHAPRGDKRTPQANGALR